MKFTHYLKDKLCYLIISVIGFGIMILIFISFKVEKSVITSGIFIFIMCSVIILLLDFFRKRRFYSELLSNINLLDKAYLVLETLEKPEFYEGNLTFQAIYEINKSMIENINLIYKHNKDFKEYVEMWIHEVKIPLSSISLIVNNHKDKTMVKVKSQLKRLEDYVDQILYYVRSENAENDYLIKKINLMNVIKNVGLKNMDALLESKIEFIVENVDVIILSDSKWLEFILEQIINNSIKYKRNVNNSYIKISSNTLKTKTILTIEDNGIGIKESDIKQVFDKSFTGENGRIKSKSTGMGLFIAKNMCEKLGHKITVESSVNKYTKVHIIFSKNEFYDLTE